ncbi:MAG: hypothetical protein ACREHD_29090, partial [Pirellulales bacterium]
RILPSMYRRRAILLVWNAMFLPAVLALRVNERASDLASAAGPREIATQPANTWTKRSPLPDGPVSPRLGYEGACVWNRLHRKLVRYGGHNQGGGGEQGAEVWVFEPQTAEWTLNQPNTSPPGVCCNAQNIYDPTHDRYLRFPFFSGSHGWQWARELYLNDSSVWTYDLAANRWRNMRPLPAPRSGPWSKSGATTSFAASRGGRRHSPSPLWVLSARSDRFSG